MRVPAHVSVHISLVGRRGGAGIAAGTSGLAHHRSGLAYPTVGIATRADVSAVGRSELAGISLAHPATCTAACNAHDEEKG